MQGAKTVGNGQYSDGWYEGKWHVDVFGQLKYWSQVCVFDMLIESSDTYKIGGWNWILQWVKHLEHANIRRLYVLDQEFVDDYFLENYLVKIPNAELRYISFQADIGARLAFTSYKRAMKQRPIEEDEILFPKYVDYIRTLPSCVSPNTIF